MPERWEEDGDDPLPIGTLREPIADLLRTTSGARPAMVAALRGTASHRGQAASRDPISRRYADHTLDTRMGGLCLLHTMGGNLDPRLTVSPAMLHLRDHAMVKARLPETLLTAAMGRRLGELVEMPEDDLLAQARIQGVREIADRIALRLDLAVARLAMNDIHP